MALSNEERKRQQAEYNKEYRAVNAAAIKAQKAAKYLENGDALKAALRARYSKDSDKIRARNSAWKKANRKTVNAIARKGAARRNEALKLRYATDPEYARRAKEKSRRYNAENAALIKGKNAEHYRKTKKETLEKQAVYRALNAERRRAYSIAWAAANPEKVRVNHINRRALKKNAGGKLSHGIAERLMVLQKGKCPACCSDLRKTGYHLDHIEALSKGGAHEDSNVQLLCPPCNMSKHTMHPVEFMQSRGFLL